MKISLPELAHHLSIQRPADAHQGASLMSYRKTFMPGQTVCTPAQLRSHAHLLLSGVTMHEDRAHAAGRHSAPRFTGPHELLQWQAEGLCQPTVQAVTAVRVLAIPWSAILDCRAFRRFFDDLPSTRAAASLLRDLRCRNQLAELPGPDRVRAALQHLLDLAGHARSQPRRRTARLPVVIQLASLAAWIRLDLDAVRVAARTLAQAGWIQLAGDEIRCLQDPALSSEEPHPARPPARHVVTSTDQPACRPMLSCA